MKLEAVASLVGIAGLTIGGLTAPPGKDAAGAEAVVVTREELGRLLFWDPILSGDRNVACASCHHPDLAYTDGLELSLGAGAVGLGTERRDVSDGLIPPVRRNAPTILNAAFNGFDDDRGRRRSRQLPGIQSIDQARVPMFWDSRVRSLEAQALIPLTTFDEMRGNAYPEEVAIDTVVMRLRSIPEYVALFAGVFGLETQIDSVQVAEAIASFERTLLAMNSPFDRFRAGDTEAPAAEQRRGMEEFDDAGCDRCHEGVMFSDFDLRTLGVAENVGLSAPDMGAGRFRFRTPSLRNVALTAPYMHNGVLATLEDVLEFYDDGRSENPAVATNRNRRNEGEQIASVDRDFRRVDDLSQSERRAIIAFLAALTDPDFDRTIPTRVPSGLPPGGAIHE